MYIMPYPCNNEVLHDDTDRSIQTSVYAAAIAGHKSNA